MDVLRHGQVTGPSPAALPARQARREQQSSAVDDVPLPVWLEARGSVERLTVVVADGVALILAALLWRVAIAEAERVPDIAAALDSIGRARTRAVLATALSRAQDAGLLRTGGPERVAEHFFGLLWGDLRLGVLLGVAPSPRKTEIEERARDAAQAFLAAYWAAN